MKDRKKKIASLVVVLIVGSGLASLAARSEDQNAVGAESEPKQQAPLLTDSDAFKPSDSSFGNGELLYTMMLSVVVVGVLGVAALYISKRVLPKVANRSGKEIRVLETAYLGPRKAIHLVEVNNQKLLIGSTNDSIAMLSHIGEGWLDVSEQEPNDAVSL